MSRRIVVVLFKAVPIITDLRQAREANMARTLEGLHMVPSGASCNIKISSSMSSFPNSQRLLCGFPNNLIFLVAGAASTIAL